MPARLSATLGRDGIQYELLTFENLFEDLHAILMAGGCR